MQYSTRLRRKAGEEASVETERQVRDFLTLCIEEGLDDDEIVILARTHAPTRATWDYDFDGAVERQLVRLRSTTAAAGLPLALDWGLLESAPAEPVWCIEGFVQRGQNVSLTGKAKVGKSLLSLEAAAAKASGTTFLGRELEPGRVLYLDYENQPDMIRQRLRSMGFSSADLSELIYLSFPPWGALDSPAGSKAVLEEVERRGSEIVFIDTVQRVITGDENNSQGIRDLHRNLLMRLAANGVATVRLDHLGKEGTTSARGSSAKGDDVDDAWIYSEDRDGRFALRRVLSRSGVGPSEYLLDRTEDPLQHLVVAEALQPDDDTRSQVEVTVARLDELGEPDSIGRDKAKTALKEAGHSYSTDALSAALKIRQGRT